MSRIALAVLMGMGLVAGSVYAENHAFEFSKELKQGEQRPGFTKSNGVDQVALVLMKEIV